MGKSAEKKGKRMTKRMLTAAMADMFQEYKDEDITLNKVFQELRLKTHPLKMLAGDVISEMLEDGYVEEVRKGHYKLAACQQIAETEEEEAESIVGKQYVGTLKVTKNYAMLSTNSREVGGDVFIPKEKLKNGKNGDKALVKIVDMPDKTHRFPIGHVVDILGKSGDNDTEMHAILAEYGLPYVYPQAVEKAANEIDEGITENEIAHREDYRDVLTFTIDPHDAKDFDDALSIRKMKDGQWEIGVHIADVTHYVTEGSLIDKEAQRRATSVYLVDRTVPMLPERLCNYICSLRPDEDKLCYAVIVHMDDKGKVRYNKIVHTVIRSNRRYNYEEVQAIIDREEGKQAHPYGTFKDQFGPLPGDEYANELMTLHRLAQILRKERFDNGSIAFDRIEVGFDIDEKGHPVSVHLKEQTTSHQLIEEFMLLANRIVATTIGMVPTKQQKVFPYRIHDLPDIDKLDNVARFITRFGYRLKTTGTKDDVTQSINKLLSDVKGKKEQNLIETISLKAMQKARYSTENIGHYGLAFGYYTHFTSTIRRYPDMMVHRLLARYLAGGRSASKVKYEELCDHSSAMEQLAASAERASIKYKQVEFMQDRMGQTFDAVISGVTEWGLYAEIVENKCEGLIPMRDLDDDYYEYDDKNYCLVGRRTHNRYCLGDPVKVQVARCDLEKKQLDFALVE